MIFLPDQRWQKVTSLWETHNYAADDTAPYQAANLLASRFRLEAAEPLLESYIFANFLAHTGVSMANPFQQTPPPAILDRATGLYHIQWHLIHGQCNECAVFDSEPARAQQFAEEAERLIDADAWFYAVPHPNVETALYTNQTAVVWMSAEAVGLMFFLGYD